MENKDIIEKLKFALQYLNEIFVDISDIGLISEIKNFRNGIEELLHSVRNEDFNKKPGDPIPPNEDAKIASEVREPKP